MDFLEKRDFEERKKHIPREKRLRQIPKDEGPILTLLLSLAPMGLAFEVGTSGGYSTLWQFLALKKNNRKLTTIERRVELADLAEKIFTEAGVFSQIELIKGEAVTFLSRLKPNSVAWCFIDAEDSDLTCFRLIANCLVDGGLIVVDDVNTHRSELEKIELIAKSDYSLDVFRLNIGNGILVCQK